MVVCHVGLKVVEERLNECAVAAPANPVPHLVGGVPLLFIFWRKESRLKSHGMPCHSVQSD